MKMNFKLITSIVIGIAIGFSSCKKDPADGSSDLATLTLECNSFKGNNTEVILVLENRNNTVDYIIDCTIPVEIDLKIEPGVVIEFTDNAGMKIETTGSVSAIGTQSKPIVFTGEDKAKGSWKGVHSFSESVKNRFDYVTIEYGGGDSFNSNGDLGNPTLRSGAYFLLNNVTLKNGFSYGLNAKYGSYRVEINNLTITECKIPMYINAHIANEISNGEFTGNTTDVIRIRGTEFSNTTHTWKDLGVPYRISSLLTIKNGAVLTINPGVIVEFEGGQSIRLSDDNGEALIAVGTQEKPITFTGVTKLPGSWESIYFVRTSSPQNQISYAIIEYAGGGSVNGAIEMGFENPTISITNTKFKDISSCAIYDYDYPSSPNPNLTENNNIIENVSGGYMCI